MTDGYVVTMPDHPQHAAGNFSIEQWESLSDVRLSNGERIEGEFVLVEKEVNHAQTGRD